MYPFTGGAPPVFPLLLGARQSRRALRRCVARPSRLRHAVNGHCPIIASVLAAAAVLASLVPCGAQGSRPGADGFLDKVKAAMASVKTTRGTFKQTKKLAIFDDKVESDGAFAIQRPDRLRWAVERPFRSILVIAGDRGARWNETRKAVERFSVAEKPGIDVAVKQLFMWYAGRYETAADQFDLAIDAAGRRIAMTPKNKKVREVVARITIELDSSLGTLRSIVLEEDGGDSTTIAFDKVETNVDLAATLFELDGK